MTRIVVSGAGVWSGAGTSLGTFWDRIVQGPSVATMTALGRHRIPVVVSPDPPPDPRFPQARRMDRSVHLGLAAASMAYAEARLESLDPDRIGILVGNSRGPVGKWSEPALSRPRPTQAANTAIASLSGALSMAFRTRGPAMTVSATCASSAHAIALGASLLLSGDADAVLAGGSEAPLIGTVLDQFHAAGLVASGSDPATACRPFARDRDGIVPGEGAGFLVLETERHARSRGIRPLAELAGWSIGSEAHNRVATRPDGAGLARAIRLALSRAGMSGSRVGYINAHGTGTRVNDAAEAAAIESVFGRGEGAPWVSSTKPITGHAFGAAGALEAVVAVLVLARRVAPPILVAIESDPALSIHLVLGAPTPLETNHVLSLSLGFWGNTAALLFGTPGAD